MGTLTRRNEAALFNVAVAVSVALVSTAAALLYRKYRLKNAKSREDTQRVEPINNPVLLAAFEEAAERIGKMPASKLSNEDRLLLYALYKQTTVGDAPASFSLSSSWNIIKEQAKHTTWSRLIGFPRETAAAKYIALVEELEARDENYVPKDQDGLASGLFAPTVSRPAMENGGYENGDDSPESQLLLAASENDVTTLEGLLEMGVDVNYQDSQDGQTAMHLAADKGSIQCVEKLLQHGANASAKDHDGISVLQAAVIAGHVDTCRLLLKHGADPDQEDTDGDTPRSCAKDDGSAEMKKLFKF